MGRTIDLDRIRLPIPGSHPAGAYLVYDAVYRGLDEARHVPDGPDWKAIARLGLEALGERTKDLQIAAEVTEALGRLEGLDGLRQGFELCRALQEAFWDHVHPPIDGDGLDARLPPYEFLEAAIPPILHVAVPLTGSPVGENYTLHRFQSARAQGESDALAEAIRRTDPTFHRRLAADLAACRSAFDAWMKSTVACLDGKAPTFRQARGFLDDLETALATIAAIRPFQAPEPPPAPAPVSEVEPAGEAPRVPAPSAEGPSPPSAVEDPARAARGLAAAGRIDAAIEVLDRARQSARCRRDRFVHQLELVELCVRSGLIPLARPLLDEIAGDLDERKLEDWEDPALCGRVLEAALVCLRSSPTEEDHHRIPSIFERLCRLDPRRAMGHRPE